MEMAGKAALVLGGIKGIGKAVALALAQAGAAVAVNYFDWEEELEGLRRDLSARGRDHLILRTDLRRVDEIPAAMQQVVGRFGRLDFLINNIERGGWPVVHGPYVREQWDLEMETTLRAKRWVFAAALPFLKASGAGAVVNFSSIAGLVGRTAMPPPAAQCRCSPKPGRGRPRPRCASTRSCSALSKPATGPAPAAGGC